jgi:hypothetical protein
LSGAQAVNAYARPRLTQDVDIAEVRALLGELEQALAQSDLLPALEVALATVRHGGIPAKRR